MTREEIERLEALEKAATPGEWTEIVSHLSVGRTRHTSWTIGVSDDKDDDVARSVAREEDARLIAATRNALPALLAMARAVADLGAAQFPSVEYQRALKAVLAIADAAARGGDGR